METLLIKVERDHPDPEKIEIAAKIIKDGGLVGMPTETVYGLAANALDTEAVGKIFTAKGRPQDNPLIVHIDDISWLDKLCVNVPESALKLAAKFWPGPLTIIMKKSDLVPGAVSKGLGTVAIRFPSHKTALALIKASGVPIAAPSANISGRPSPTTAAHVMTDLSGKIEAVLDAGECDVGVESTVVSLVGNVPALLRPGRITLPDLQSVLGEVKVDKAVTSKVDPGEKVMAPGMKYRHYAPKAKVHMIKGTLDSFITYIEENYKNPYSGLGIMCFDGDIDAVKSHFPAAVVMPFGREHDNLSQAKKLFAVLREFDKIDSVGHIYARSPSSEGVGLAVYNRLSKAAGFDIVSV